MKNWQAVLLGFLLGLAVSAAILLVSTRPQGTPILLAQVPTRTAIQVHVAGSVRKPDVYVLSPDARISEAITAAGGPTSNANLDAINLAAGLRDGDKIWVPSIDEPTPPFENQATPAKAFGPKININQATVEELDRLPGIGTLKAQDIVDYRNSHGPFKTLEDIQNVPGIGNGIFEQIADLITVGDE